MPATSIVSHSGLSLLGAFWGVGVWAILQLEALMTFHRHDLKTAGLEWHEGLANGYGALHLVRLELIFQRSAHLN